MSEPLVFQYPSHSFMQNQFPSSLNGFRQPLYQPVKPNRIHRKRKIIETDIDDTQTQKSQTPSPAADLESVYLKFIKPSNKRRRTNAMDASDNQNAAIVNPDLERNIYCNDLRKPHSDALTLAHTQTNNHNSNANSDEYRNESPYTHLVHPYLRRKASMSPNQDKDESPEYMLSQLHLNGFRLKNTENETVNDWKESIESQLNKARQQTSNTEELCQRIANSSGLGRAVLLAKLRKELPNELFYKICDMMKIDPCQSYT